MVKDKEISKNNIHLRKVGNSYNLNYIYNVNVYKEDDKNKIIIEFFKNFGDYNNIIKKILYFNIIEVYEQFYEVLKYFCKLNNIIIN